VDLLIRAAALAASALPAALPSPTTAETPEQVFDCGVVTVCTGSGECRDAGGAVSLSLHPIDIAPDGSGKLEMRYDGIRATARTFSDLGPWVWSETGNDRQILMPSGRDALVWHHLTIGVTPRSETHFLSCEVG
jgi:hypothetical protein